MFVDLMRDKAKQVPTIADPLAVESLRIWHCSYKTLEPISACKNLRALNIATFPDPTFEVLANMHDLQDLWVIHLPKINTLEPLAKLTRLGSLSLEVLPSWDASRKRTVVTSLEPLTRIAGLKHLSLIGVVPEDLSLNVLERCKTLVTAKFHGYPKDEIARFFSNTGIENSHNPSFQTC